MVLTRGNKGDDGERARSPRARSPRERAQEALDTQRLGAAGAAVIHSPPAAQPGRQGLPGLPARIIHTDSPESPAEQSPATDTEQWRGELSRHSPRAGELRGQSQPPVSSDQPEARLQRHTHGVSFNVPAGSAARKAGSMHSQASNRTDALRREAELAAMERLKQLRFEEIRLERELVEKRLAVEMERIDEQSRAAGSQPDSERRVNDWLTDVYAADADTARQPRPPTPPRDTRGPRREEAPRTPHSQRERSTGRGRAIDRLTDTIEAMMRPPPKQVYELPPFSGEPIIEKYTENVRFCIICNYLGKIIPALQSRCTRFRFAPLNSGQVVPRLREIAANEGVEISEDGLKALLTLSGGDMRKVLNTLQSTWLAYRRVTEDTVYTCVGHPLRSDINAVLNWLLNENDFAVCFKNIQDLKITKGLALSDILTEIHTVIQRMKLPPEVLISLLIKMADAEARLSSGCSERIELAALIAAFQVARDQVKLEDVQAS